VASDASRRVPNERDNAGTTQITVRFPEGLTFVSFQPKPGWKRSVEMETLAEPIAVFGEEVTERIASVTWRGGGINPSEFEEFGVSFRVPETPGGSLIFPAPQTYSNGEVVRWIDPDPGAETPARRSQSSRRPRRRKRRRPGVQLPKRRRPPEIRLRKVLRLRPLRAPTAATTPRRPSL
jgi:hypothetical protein